MGQLQKQCSGERLPRRWVWLLVFLFVMSCGAAASAQPRGDNRNPQEGDVPQKIPRGAQGDTQETKIQMASPGKSYVAEGIIVGILFSGCLFVICKTSWRR